MTDDPSRPADRRPPARGRRCTPRPRAIRAGRRRQRHRAGARCCGPTTTFVTPDRRRGPPHGHHGRRRRASTAATATRRSRAFEEAIAELEGAEAARAFASGMGAVSAVVLGLCSTGDHIVAQRQLYAGTQLLLQAACPRFGIDVTFVDGTEPRRLRRRGPARARPCWCFAETPANPRLDLVDLDELGAITGPMTVVDSTFATPLGQRPLDHGVDLVLHSATKAIAGHNDATLGVVAGSAGAASTGCGASPCCRAPTPRRSTR